MIEMHCHMRKPVLGDRTSPHPTPHAYVKHAVSYFILFSLDTILHCLREINLRYEG